MMLRADLPLVTLRFFSVVPEERTEVCRLQMSHTHLQRMIYIMCRSTDYWPKPSDGEEILAPPDATGTDHVQGL